METSMTPSEAKMTEGQIGRILEILGAQLRKHADEFPSDAVQQALGARMLSQKLFAVVREHVEACTDFVIRVVRQNRSYTPQEAIRATSRVEHLNDDVVAAMPRGEGEETEVVFFKVGKDISCKQLDEEYAIRGLVPADPYSLARVNEEDPAFADEHPNGTQWKDANGNYCYAFFLLWEGRRDVDVDRNAFDWVDVWWFAGVRK